jgi:hypothetical protein
MAFLNIEAKLRETFIDGAPLMSFVRAVRRAARRVFLPIRGWTEGADESLGDFAGRQVTARRRGFPICPDIPTAGSNTVLKGNQLSFSKNQWHFRQGASSLVHSADVDIDLGRGLAHAKEWLDNSVFRPGHKTDQSRRCALLYARGFFPVRWTLFPRPRRAAPPLS